MPVAGMAGMVIDRHALACIGIAAVALDVLGALYLAYDLLGGEHGPLRTLTRAVTSHSCILPPCGACSSPIRP